MRNAFSIMMMLPQVKSGNGESAWDDFQVGGGQQHDWNVSVDGLSVEMGWRNHVGYMNRLTPPVDSVQEFRLRPPRSRPKTAAPAAATSRSRPSPAQMSCMARLSTITRASVSTPTAGCNNKLGRPKADLSPQRLRRKRRRTGLHPEGLQRQEQDLVLLLLRRLSVSANLGRRQ